MSLKMKLTSTICSFILILGLVITGVFAVPQATVNLGGTLTFNATDVYAKVSGVIAGTAATSQPTLETLEFKAGIETDVSSWSNVPLTFTDTGSAISILVSIENLATDRPLYASLNDSVKVDNVKKTMQTLTSATATSGSTYNGQVIELAKSTGEGTSVAYIKMTLEIDDKNASLSDTSSWGYLISLNNDKPAEIQAVEGSDILKYDSTKGYYYLEMGTYNEAPVRWRYVSDVTNGIETAQRYAPSTVLKPNFAEGAKGMFILESDIFTANTLMNADTNDGIIEILPSNMYAFSNRQYYHTTAGYTDVYANDYAASNLRAFLTGRTNVAGQDVGNLMNVIGIDSSNSIYQKIQGRTLTDLYSSINEDGSTLTLPTQFEGSATDMFWSLSNNEALQILGGGKEEQNELLWKSPAYAEFIGNLDEEDRPVDEEEYWNAFYWLRSSWGSNYVCYVDLVGGIDGNLNPVEIFSFAARPAFILEF